MMSDKALLFNPALTGRNQLRQGEELPNPRVHHLAAMRQQSLTDDFVRRIDLELTVLDQVDKKTQ